MAGKIESPAGPAGQSSSKLERRWMTVPQAAEYLSVSVRTIRNAIYDGKLPRAKLGRRFILDVRDLDAWAESEKEREIEPEGR